MAFEDQAAEEDVDLQLITSLEVDVVRFLGDQRTPNYLQLALAKLLQQGSQLASTGRATTPLWLRGTAYGSTTPATASHARTSLTGASNFCFFCARTHRKRTRSCTNIVGAARAALAGYVADEILRGNILFPRVREEKRSC
ncbi:hypothetical protein FA95DRAFT_1611608 [Auriscalpium vulgare]|uniref:Uncharacterized protein n=1 Tax=Auriscalpium vulgare TaxID=40419 RepID=A0ACB8R926_9AGAM|nr:hypothetical protein FA95DRAFT_1611608 [Auriscalpium vulgare]